VVEIWKTRPAQVMQNVVPGHEEPHDPVLAGRAGRGTHAVTSAWPDPDGNRAERRAAQRAGRRKLRKLRKEDDE
jgi:hypothetical protein